MEYIASLIPVINSSKFAKELGESGQLRQLFELIKSGKVFDDEVGRDKIYGKSGSSLAFKKLKQRLRDKLTEYVILNGVAFKNLDDYARVYRKCMVQVMAVKTLSLSNAKAASINIAENLIKTTVANEYTDLTLYLSRELFTYYTSLNYHAKKSRRYQSIMISSQILYARELEANKFYCDLRLVFNQNRGSLKDKSLATAIKYCDKISPYLRDQNVSYQLLLHGYSIVAMRYELEKDYKCLLDICNQATNVFNSRKVNRRAGFYQFDIYKILCYLQFQEYDKVEIIANAYFEQMTRSSINWFVLKIYVMVGRLHAGDYQSAYDLVEEVRNDQGYKKLPETILQTWIIYEAHFEFLISIGKVKANRASKFRLYKFLNEIPIYTKDKRGLNIAILIVHTLVLLHQRKFSQIIDRVDALNQYCHRHLRKDDTFRSNCFIKMLLQISRADFNRKRTERYAKPYVDKLKSAPLFISDQSIEVEIIPYERLWQMTLDLLD